VVLSTSFLQTPFFKKRQEFKRYSLAKAKIQEFIDNLREEEED